MPNPRFDLSFQLDNPENVPRQTVLVFEIRSSIKEVVAACRITLQDMLSGRMIHTIMNFNLMVTICIMLYKCVPVAINHYHHHHYSII